MNDKAKYSTQILKVDAGRAAWRVVGDELVLLDLETSAYLSINQTGTCVWPQLETGARLEDLVQTILDNFQTDRAIAEQDILAFIAALQERGLLIKSPE